MEMKNEKLVRFCSDGKQEKGFMSWGGKTGSSQMEKSSAGHKLASSLLNSEGKCKIVDSLKFGGSKVFPEDHEPLHKHILDPGSDIVLNWNRVFIVSCLLALFVDPLYFYLPSIGGSKDSWCVKTDFKLRIVVTFFRTIADLFYLLHVVIKFRTAYVAPSSRVFGRGELVRDPKKIAQRYIRSDFFIDLVATLPLPQDNKKNGNVLVLHSVSAWARSPEVVLICYRFVIWFIIPATRNHRTNHNNNALALIVLFQYIPRLYLIFPLSSQIIKATGVVTKTAWAGAAYNLLLYMLASHVLGAAWYVLSVDRYLSCWKSICKREDSPTKCLLEYLNCDTPDSGQRDIWIKSTNVFRSCDPDEDITFKFGIFENAVTKQVVASTFVRKYFYCLWWGLQNLSTFIGETSFSILIAILGLVLFAHLIGNMQTYLQSLTVRLEEWRLKRRDTEEWMRHRQLPEDLRKRVRRFVQYKWLATRGVDEEAILRGLPADLSRDIQRHLCLDLVRRGSTREFHHKWGSDWFLQFYYPETWRFLWRGASCLGFAPEIGCHLPSSTRTVRALVEVEAFALRAEDLKFVANQFRRLHSKKLQHTFRFYSHHWRTWAACFIQAAWRRYKRRKMAKDLARMESFVLDETTEDNTEEGELDQSPNSSTPSKIISNLGVTILASRFAANTRRGVQKIKDVDLPKLPKPEEPDFSAEPDD
ncbi:Cyclic nucleotide-gated ion channel 17 [Sesamum angolense]|uniref:Cyclic nucleotide-gated ion channel 17 n=1 Tax=Sesamum angolense TaxID=2727404 RepID=A0AAE1X4E2_9LAMI|nr:Cyclic nucleotide-gated ion channel 17 [Sesamum angolense]